MINLNTVFYIQENMFKYIRKIIFFYTYLCKNNLFLYLHVSWFFYTKFVKRQIRRICDITYFLMRIIIELKFLMGIFGVPVSVIIVWIPMGLFGVTKVISMEFVSIDDYRTKINLPVTFHQSISVNKSKFYLIII